MLHSGLQYCPWAYGPWADNAALGQHNVSLEQYIFPYLSGRGGILYQLLLKLFAMLFIPPLIDKCKGCIFHICMLTHVAFQNLLIDLEPEVFEKLDRLETMDLSSNFLMGLNLQFFVEIERKKRLRMVYLQVWSKVIGCL